MAELHVTPRHTGNGPVGERSAPPLGELLKQLAQDSATLVRQEVALAKAELRQNVRSLTRDVALVAVGAALATVGGLVLVAFLVLLLGAALGNYWLSALIVGAVFLVTGAVLAMANLRRLRENGVTPTRTVETLKEDREWLQSEIEQARKEMA